MNVPQPKQPSTTFEYSRLPLERYFRECGVGIAPVIDLLDNQSHKLRLDGAYVEFLALHYILKVQLARAAVGKVCGGRGQAIVLSPNLRALEIARQNKDSMKPYFTIEIEAYPLADAGPVHAFDPCGASLAVNRIGRIVSVALDRVSDR